VIEAQQEDISFIFFFSEGFSFKVGLTVEWKAPPSKMDPATCMCHNAQMLLTPVVAAAALAEDYLSLRLLSFSVLSVGKLQHED
jgi:hypothetical protein